MKFYFPIFLAFLLITTSCKKEPVEPVDDIVNTSSNVTAKGVLVQVEDQNGSALLGVEVKLGNQTKTSDMNGVVQFSSISLPSQNATISVSKSGYFENHYLINPSSTADVSVVLVLAEAINTTIDASNGGQVQSGGGAYIVFPANGFLNQDGSVYTGNVVVSSKYIDPSSSADNKIIPNSFIGIDESNATVFAENHGMILAEIYDNNGNELNINPANKAELHLPVLSTDMGSAPNQLPFYYFNEEAGKWLEDGAAMLETNEYVGLVDHFTFWMCPYVYDHYSLSGNIECAGTPYSGAVVNVYNQFGHFLGSRTTNVVGGFSGSIPGTLTHTIEVEDPCGDVLYSETIGPFASATNLGAIDICSSGNVNFGLVEATLTDCDGVIDQNAYLNVNFSGRTRFFPANSLGSFSRLMVFCNSTTQVTLLGANTMTNLASQPQTLPVSPSMNFGNQLVCNLPDQYCIYTVNGENFFIVDSPEKEFILYIDFSSPESSYMGVSDTSDVALFSDFVHFQLRDFGPSLGQYLIPGIGGFGYVFEGFMGQSGTTFPIEITYFGTGVGDYVEGTITGSHSYVDGFGNNVTVGPAQFRVQIDTYTP